MSSKQNHKIIKIAIAALALGVGAPVVANQTSNQVFAASAPYDTNEMRSFVRNTLAQNKVRGTVVVIKDGHAQQISYGYGYYGRRLGAGNTKVVYPVCSLQKVITGAIITQLISEGKFNQDTKISRWYPNLKNADKITVGNLLTHTSGLLATGTEVNQGINYSEGDAINWVINRVNQLREGNPGNFYYNNTNYILLAGIIRQVTNQSYEANVKSRIINKLGLKRTFFYPDIPKSKTDAISYTWRNKNYQNAQYVKRSLASQLPGAGNLFSTPMDYYRIQVALTDGRILTKDQFNYLTHLQSRVTSYSGGVYLKNNDNLKMAYGNLYGTHFGNWFQMTTDNQNGLIMFLNQTQNNEDQNKAIGYQILNHIKANTFTEK
ncbi:serine hydrolase domain-containing protein [Lactobacillus intestinalis]|uniref:Penicillin-binding protein n=1 Tax=Lactobacillus intestinalis DSM 6629 TaxID=1423761 RepID=A0ABR5PN26_9LACO|nr:serine hydrolase domain-containing protein [Lactobacillus intestinalis]KRM31793.1 penicillin-binding protein [Lactobacillus intestinalis DSM 6629]UTW41201.1 beta-lactamase family protein [Lactobacillus intestinalis]